MSSTTLNREEIDLIHAGKAIGAIKAFFDRTRCSLKEAKDAVDRYRIDKGMMQFDDEPLLRFFAGTNDSSMLNSYWTLANQIVNTCPKTSERTVALRKLLESRDAALRVRSL